MLRSKPACARWTPLAVVCLLAIMMLQLGFSTYRNSITWDEDDHIYSGYMSLKHADFGLNPEHPPLVKMLAALPLLDLSLKTPPLQQRFFKTEAFLGGKEFIFKNDVSATTVLFRARMAASLLTLVLALLVFFAAREMFGTPAGFIALGLMVFDPNVLAHGAVVGTDMGLSCFMFATIYAFYRYVKSPSLWRLLLTGVAAGLALASKHTAILVFPMLSALAAYEAIWGGTKDETDPTSARGVELPARTRALRMTLAFVLISAVALTVLWSFYGFRYQARENGMQINPPFAQYVQGLSRPRDVRLLSTVAHWHLLPESYIYGLADVRYMADFYTSYIFGRTYPHGVWFYFPAAFLIKSSLPFLILFALAIWAISLRRLKARREILFLTIPPIIHFAVAMGAGMNIGLRHILPIYMFFYVLIGGAAWGLIRRDRRWLYAVMVLLVWQAVSSLRTYPAYIAYANEAWGGPSQTYKYLSDSNADWGQQLNDVRQYLQQHDIHNCWFVYFAQGVVDFRDYGIPCKPLPTADTLWVNEQMETPAEVDGSVLISAGDLSGFEFGGRSLNPYEQFKQLRPAAAIDYGVMVFHGHFDIPLAAAVSHAQAARNFLAAKKLPEALAEAQQAVTLAPDSVAANAAMGDTLAAMQRSQDARPYYEKALLIAKTVDPEFQRNWTATLESKLAKPENSASE